MPPEQPEQPRLPPIRRRLDSGPTEEERQTKEVQEQMDRLSTMAQTVGETRHRLETQRPPVQELQKKATELDRLQERLLALRSELEQLQTVDEATGKRVNAAVSEARAVSERHLNALPVPRLVPEAPLPAVHEGLLKEPKQLAELFTRLRNLPPARRDAQLALLHTSVQNAESAMAVIRALEAARAIADREQGGSAVGRGMEQWMYGILETCAMELKQSDINQLFPRGERDTVAGQNMSYFTYRSGFRQRSIELSQKLVSETYTAPPQDRDIVMLSPITNVPVRLPTYLEHRRRLERESAYDQSLRYLSVILSSEAFKIVRLELPFRNFPEVEAAAWISRSLSMRGIQVLGQQERLIPEEAARIQQMYRRVQDISLFEGRSVLHASQNETIDWGRGGGPAQRFDSTELLNDILKHNPRSLRMFRRGEREAGMKQLREMIINTAERPTFIFRGHGSFSYKSFFTGNMEVQASDLARWLQERAERHPPTPGDLRTYPILIFTACFTGAFIQSLTAENTRTGRPTPFIAIGSTDGKQFYHSTEAKKYFEPFLENVLDVANTRRRITVGTAAENQRRDWHNARIDVIGPNGSPVQVGRADELENRGDRLRSTLDESRALTREARSTVENIERDIDAEDAGRALS